MAKTRIFARPSAETAQLLAYAMSVGASEDLAMILPLPVPARAGEDAVRFIDLQRYPALFDDLDRGFPVLDLLDSFQVSRLAPQAKALKVVEVGAFEASFVPSIRDFSRLDRRFRMPEGVWDALPNYREFGFAVFKLRSAGGWWDRLRGRARDTEYHPMAFEFPRRDPGALFFPTLHVHDGEVHENAEFDHTLYCQGPIAESWEVSAGPASGFVDLTRSAELVDGARPCFRKPIGGLHPNADVIVPLTSAVSQ